METVVKRSVMIAGHRTSISLEEPFWTALREIAEVKGISIAQLIMDVDSQRRNSNLSSAIRVYVLTYYQHLKR